jgi:hypothetical protein
MDRRSLITAAGALATLAASGRALARPPAEADELSGFSALSNAFLGLINSVAPIADLIDQTRFYYFLLSCQALLMDLEVDKRTVRDALRNAACPSPSAYAPAAVEATQRIQTNVPKLGRAAKTLATAIKPADLRAAADKAGDELMAIASLKSAWMHEVGDYCRKTPAERDAFLAKVEASLAAAGQCRRTLGTMIDKLKP